MARTLNSVMVTTDNLEKARAFYEGELKLSLVADLRLDPAKASTLWGLDREYDVRSLVLKRRSSDQHGFVRLTHIAGAAGADIRHEANSWDLGLFTIAFSVKDSPSKIASIEKIGYGLLTRPTPSEFKEIKGGYYVTQSLIKGPNSVRLSIMERFNPPHPVGNIDEATGFSEIVDCSQAVSNLAETTAFYEMLGLTTLREFHISGPYYVGSLGIGPDEPFTMRLLGDPSYPGAHIELLHFEQRMGRQLDGQRSPLNYGYAALSFGVPDLDEVLERVRRSGARIISEPVELDIDGSGPRRVFSCYAPASVLCEVYQA